jgi:hypothetical protein
MHECNVVVGLGRLINFLLGQGYHEKAAQDQPPGFSQHELCNRRNFKGERVAYGSVARLLVSRQ